MNFQANARILVTGANGFVGKHLVERLRSLVSPDAQLLLGDHQSDGIHYEDGCRFVHLDVVDIDQVDNAIRDIKPTHIFHLAAIAAVTAADRDARRAWDVNFGGALNIALAVSRFAPDCRVVYCSSAEIYGGSFSSGLPLDETALIDPVNPYGAAKAAADVMFGQMAKQSLRVVRLRPFNHTGPGQSPQFVVPSFARQIAQIERNELPPIIQVGDLRSRRDFLDIDDVVDAYVSTLLDFDKIPSGAAINIASGHARSIQEVLDELLSYSSRDIQVQTNPELLRAAELPIVQGDARLCKELLGWQPRRPWSTTLQSVLQYWRTTPAL